MKETSLLSRILQDDITEEISRTNMQNKRLSVENGKTRMKVNFLDTHDPDILSMPVLTLEKPEVMHQLKKPSQLGESWHLISRDILSPLGIKHRSIIKHKLEQGKKTKRFLTSTLVEKEIKKKNQAKEERINNLTLVKISPMREKATWFSRSPSLRKKTTIIKSVQGYEFLDLAEKPKQPPIEIAAKKSYKTVGQIMNQQMLNMSWDNPPVVSLWDTLETEETDQTKPPARLPTLQPKGIAASRRITPVYNRNTLKNTGEVRSFRRKSCECLLCGGVSNLEVRTSHINYEVLRPEHKHKAHISLKDIHLINQTLKFVNLAQSKKRESGSNVRASSNNRNFRGTRNFLGVRSGGLTVVNSPISGRNIRKISDDPNELDSVSGLHSNTTKNADSRGDDDLKSSKQISRNSLETPDQSPRNKAPKPQELGALTFPDVVHDRHVRSHLPSMNEVEEESSPIIHINTTKSKFLQKSANYKLQVESASPTKLSRWKGARYQTLQERDLIKVVSKTNGISERDNQGYHVIQSEYKEDPLNSGLNSGTNTLENSPAIKNQPSKSRTLFDLTQEKEDKSPEIKRPKIKSGGSLDHKQGPRLVVSYSQEEPPLTTEQNDYNFKVAANNYHSDQAYSKESKLETISETPVHLKSSQDQLAPPYSGSTLPNTEAKKDFKRSLSTPKQMTLSSESSPSVPITSTDKIINKLRIKKHRKNKSLHSFRPNTSTDGNILKIYKTTPSALEENPIKPVRKSGSPNRHIYTNSSELRLEPILERDGKNKKKFIRLIRGSDTDDFLKNHSKTTFYHSFSRLQTQEHSKEFSIDGNSKGEKQIKNKQSSLEFHIPLIDPSKPRSRKLLSRSTKNQDNVSKMITVYKTLHGIEYTTTQKQLLEKIFPLSTLTNTNTSISKRTTGL